MCIIRDAMSMITVELAKGHACNLGKLDDHMCTLKWLLFVTGLSKELGEDVEELRGILLDCGLEPYF